MAERNMLHGEMLEEGAMAQVRADLTRFIQDEERRLLRGGASSHEQYLASVAIIKTLRSALKILEVNREN